MARDRIDVEPDLPTIANTPALKAAGFNSLTSVLRSMASDADFQRFTEALPPGSREAVSCPPLAVTWVPLTDAAPIWEAAYEHLFARNDERMFELGRLQLRTDMLGIFRLVLRVATPAFVASRTGEIYASYTRNCGSLRSVLSEPRRLHILMDERPLSSKPFCEYMRGSVFGVLELTGVRELAVTIGERNATSSRCRFESAWA